MMKQKEQQEIKILDIFNFPNNLNMTIVDCKIEPMIGDYLIDENENVIWKIKGVVTHIKHDPNIKPMRYLGNKNYLRSISLKAITENIKLNKGDLYYLKRPPLLV